MMGTSKIRDFAKCRISECLTRTRSGGRSASLAEPVVNIEAVNAFVVGRQLAAGKRLTGSPCRCEQLERSTLLCRVPVTAVCFLFLCKRLPFGSSRSYCLFCQLVFVHNYLALHSKGILQKCDGDVPFDLCSQKNLEI